MLFELLNTVYTTTNLLEKSNSNITNLVDLLRYRNQNQADNIAFTFLSRGETQEVSLTYKELDKKARAIAAVLQSMKVRGERALLVYQPGLEFIAAFFGCLYAGVVAVPVYPPRRNHHSNRLQAIVSDAQATIALTTTSVFNNIEKSLKSETELAILRCITTDEIDNNQANDWQLPDIENDTLAFLQYTSGSTGTPKGVMVSHKNLLHNLSLIHNCFEHTPNSQSVIWLPLYHDMGLIGGVLQPLYGGFPVTLMSPTAFVKKPYRWLQAISRYQATTSGGPNFAYDLCVRQITPEQRATLDLSSWDIAFTGAEPIRAQTLERFATTFADCGFRREAFYPCYGMAETTLIVSGGIKAEPPIIHHVNGSQLEQNRVVESTGQKEGDKAIVGCGRTWLEHKITIVDPESLTPCPSGKVGEIWVSGSSVAGGYWNQPEQTQQTFYNYLADNEEETFLRTGDLGFLHNGELFITSRLQDLIIISGRNYFPQDIEYTVEQCHHALRSNCGAAFSVEIQNQERLIITQEVECNYLRKLNTEEIIKTILRTVSEKYEIQVYAVLLLKTGSIPKTSSGKIQRSVCRAKFLAGNLDVVVDWSMNPEYKTKFQSLKMEVESLLKQLQNQSWSSEWVGRLTVDS